MDQKDLIDEKINKLTNKQNYFLNSNIKLIEINENNFKYYITNNSYSIVFYYDNSRNVKHQFKKNQFHEFNYHKNRKIKLSFQIIICPNASNVDIENIIYNVNVKIIKFFTSEESNLFNILFKSQTYHSNTYCFDIKTNKIGLNFSNQEHIRMFIDDTNTVNNKIIKALNPSTINDILGLDLFGKFESRLISVNIFGNDIYEYFYLRMGSKGKYMLFKNNVRVSKTKARKILMDIGVKKRSTDNVIEYYIEKKEYNVLNKLNLSQRQIIKYQNSINFNQFRKRNKLPVDTIIKCKRNISIGEILLERNFNHNELKKIAECFGWDILSRHGRFSMSFISNNIDNINTEQLIMNEFSGRIYIDILNAISGEN